MIKKYAIIIIILFSINVFAQTDPNKCNCCTAEYRQFDFWLGEWDVYNLEGVKVGENRIIEMQDSCVIQENWSGSSGFTGTSYSFYDKRDNTWNQTYIDNSGTVLVLKGIFEDDKMVLKSEKIKSKRDDFYYKNRIIWSKDISGKVSQKWEIVDDDDKVLQVVFDGIYEPKTSSGKSDAKGHLQKSISTIELVKVLNNKSTEALFYLEHNWKVFREIALKNDFIRSYQLISTKPDSTLIFDIILITEYANDADYKLSEERFQKIIKEARPKGPLFLNELRPNEFRQSVFVKESETLIIANEQAE